MIHPIFNLKFLTKLLKKERNKRNLLYWPAICLEDWSDKL